MIIVAAVARPVAAAAGPGCHMPDVAFHTVASAVQKAARRTSRSSRGDLALPQPCVECHEDTNEH